MTPEEQEKLTNMATLYDSLSPTLKQIFISQIGYGEMIISKELSDKLNNDPNWWKPETIQNTSNASSNIDVLKEEFGEHLCSCSLRRCECLHIQ